MSHHVPLNDIQSEITSMHVKNTGSIILVQYLNLCIVDMFFRLIHSYCCYRYLGIETPYYGTILF